MTKPLKISPELTKALRDAPIQPRDVAGVRLAKRYAQLIDEAAELADKAAEVWESLEPEDVFGRRRMAELERMVEAHRVASDLGPKLLAALTALGMVPAARTTGKEANGGPIPGAAGLDELRARRADRSRRASAVDASAP